MAGKFEDLVALCTSQVQQLQSFVEGIPSQAWSIQSACGEWQIGDVVAHLAASANLFADLVPAMARGTAAQSEWKVPNPERQATVADQAKELRGRLGDDGLRRHLTDGTRRFVEALRALRPEDADKTSPAAMEGRRTIYQVLGVRIGEMVIHRWDMESRLRPEARFAPETLPVLMGYLAGWRAFSFQRKEPRRPVHYRWETTGTPPATWDLVIRGDSFEHVRSASSWPDVLFQTDPDTYILVGVGRLDFGATVREGRIRAQGDPAAIEAYPAYFRSL